MTLRDLLVPALARRPDLPEAARLFHGPTEGDASLVLDLYRSTLVVYDREPREEAAVRALVEEVQALAPKITSAVWKTRKGERESTVLFGTPDTEVVEDGVTYALDLASSQDASFYLDTALLRRALREGCAGERVLNTFAYTASLSVAAKAGGAKEVVSVDRNKAFLEIGRRSYMKNRFPLRRGDFVARDVFAFAGDARKRGLLFDRVIVDPPFFSDAPSGRVDVVGELPRLVDKLRPLVAHEGRLVVVANALFLPGKAVMDALAAMAPWVSVEGMVPVPTWAAGEVGPDAWPADPTPFGHPTKMVVVKVRRKDERRG